VDEMIGKNKFVGEIKKNKKIKKRSGTIAKKNAGAVSGTNT
jgi:hypothetical protein